MSHNRDVNPDLAQQWAVFRNTVSNLELDAQKTIRGNHASGVRFRRGLRSLKAIAAKLIADTIADGMQRIAERKASK